MKETMVEARVTYTLLREGKFYVIEHVPARVCVETEEQFFAPETVEHVQTLIKGRSTPTRVIEAQVYEYA
ncbi:MAG: YgiT-type zinc finger protein [Methylococcales bacterium]